MADSVSEQMAGRRRACRLHLLRCSFQKHLLSSRYGHAVGCTRRAQGLLAGFQLPASRRGGSSTRASPDQSHLTAISALPTISPGAGELRVSSAIRFVDGRSPIIRPDRNAECRCWPSSCRQRCSGPGFARPLARYLLKMPRRGLTRWFPPALLAARIGLIGDAVQAPDRA